VTLAALLIVFFGLIVGSKSAIADGVDVPEQVSAYFASGLVPRLADLYLAGAKEGETAPFDATAKVGTIRRLSAWTADFSAGKATETPTELTNQWVAPVSDKSGTVLGLATVWINPGSDLPELADFNLGATLVTAVGKAPAAMRLVHDSDRSAWFATDGKKLVPLVAGSSGLAAESTVADYQKVLRAHPVKPVGEPAAANPGLVFAGVTLGGVVLLLAVVILLPGRKRRDGSVPATDEPADAELVMAEVVPATADVAADVAAAAPKKPAPKKAAPRTTAPRTTAPSAATPRTTAPKTATPRTTAPKSTAVQKAAPAKPAPKKPAVPKVIPKKATPAEEG
jgi:hypothetical protein